MFNFAKRVLLPHHFPLYPHPSFTHKFIQTKYRMSTLAIDQGTSSTRVILFDESFKAIQIAQRPIKLYTRREGWAEQNGEEIVESVVQCIDEIGLDGVNCIGLTNQRESTVAWSKASGTPLCPVISWMDLRTREIVKRKEFHSDHLKECTGLQPSTYFSLPKMIWMLENVEKVKKAAEEDDLCFGTVDSWLLTRLTGLFVTDPSNASRTMLMGLKEKAWDDKLLGTFKISKHWLPEIRTDNYGFIEGVPVRAVMGDQHSSFYAHSAPVKCTYGTGTFLFVDTGKEVCPQEDLICTVAYGDKYAIEAPMNIGGSLLNWLASLFRVNQRELLAMAEKGSDGVVFVPFNPMAPIWKTQQGSFNGLSLGTTREDMARAVVKAIAVFVGLSLERLEPFFNKSDKTFDHLVVDGGLANSDLLMQMQADVLGKPVYRPKFLEYTALGIAMMCNKEKKFAVNTEFDIFTPNPTSSMRNDLLRTKNLLNCND